MSESCERKKPAGGVLLFGIFILSLFFFSLLNTTALFAIRIPISRFNIISAIICSGLVCFFLSGQSKKQTTIVLIGGVLLLGIAMLLSARVYDWSWDGNRYHKSITGALNYGWNPLRETFYDFANDFPFLAEVEETWYDAYPKGSEIWAACLYAVSGNIESGKCFNFLAAIALFCICCSILSQTKRFYRPQVVLCAFLCVANPIVLSQIDTYYVDGFLSQVLLACMVALLYLTFFESGTYQKSCRYLVFISISIGFNVKFSALIYFAILCGSFWGYWTVRKLRHEGWQISKKWIRYQFRFFAVSAIFGVVVTGVTSYVVNLLRHANPVYTLIGEGSTEMITSQLPVVYGEMGNLSRFVASFFSKTSNNRSMDNIEWKFPFMFSADEISAAQTHDARVAGWGILFSGIFLISLLVIGVGMIRMKGKKGTSVVTSMTTLLLCTLFLSICLVPGLSWARYNAVLFYIPVGALLYLFGLSNQNKRVGALSSFTAGMLSIALFLNMVPNIERLLKDFEEYTAVKQQLTEFKTITEQTDEPVLIGYTEYRFEGRFFTLYDMGITNFQYGAVDSKNCSGKLFNHDRTLCYDIIETQTAAEFMEDLHSAENRIILFAVKDEGSNALTSEFIEQMRGLGLRFELKDHFRYSYLAVIDGTQVLYEDMDEDAIYYNGIAAGKQISVTSAGYLAGNISSIKIDEIEYAKNVRGLNIVVLDSLTGNVIDSVGIDTYLDNKLSRYN